jgi:mono/diheme cytochrome c family protein
MHGVKIPVQQTRTELGATLLGILASAVTLGATFGFAALMRHYTPLPAPVQTADAKRPQPDPATGPLVEKGHHLFAANCAHCHGSDATGDEGPDLHGVTKSDDRISALILHGIKGEMPKFGQKLKDDDVRALIAFLRALKN